MGSTLSISLASLLFVWAVSLPIGIYSAVRRHSVGDHVFTFLGFLGLAIPNFILALTLMYVSYRYFGQSVGGLFSPRISSRRRGAGTSSSTCSRHLWIPIIVIGTNGTAALIRILRANLTDELNKPYVITARAKGLPEYQVILKYPVRIALNPVRLGDRLGAARARSPASPSPPSSSTCPTAGPLLLRALIVAGHVPRRQLHPAAWAC